MTKRIARRAPQLLTEAEYLERLEAQAGTCAVPGCNGKPKTRRLHVDHNHRTGAVRGLLCHRCNRALPAWMTAELLRNLAAYLDLDEGIRND